MYQSDGAWDFYKEKWTKMLSLNVCVGVEEEGDVGVTKHKTQHLKPLTSGFKCWFSWCSKVCSFYLVTQIGDVFENT